MVLPPLSSLPTSLPLARPPRFVFTLCGTRSLVRPMASPPSSFLLPFPLPLAGVSAERRRQGADPAAAGEERQRERNTAGVRGA